MVSGRAATSGPAASESPALVCCATMFMWYFEYSYDSTAVLNPKRSVTGVGESVPVPRMY